jgi:hypothetical protein
VSIRGVEVKRTNEKFLLVSIFPRALAEVDLKERVVSRRAKPLVVPVATTS